MSHTCTIHKATCKLNCASSIKQVRTRHALGARMSHTCTIHKATCKLNCASSIKQVRTRHAL